MVTPSTVLDITPVSVPTGQAVNPVSVRRSSAQFVVLLKSIFWAVALITETKAILSSIVFLFISVVVNP
jgi:hypothetical protein